MVIANPMKYAMSKYHGLGNDYIIYSESEIHNLSIDNIKRLCNRHFGVGSDGVLIDTSKNGEYSLRIINPDGSEAEKSGNGLRIFAKYLYDNSRVDHDIFNVNTLGGIVNCKICKDSDYVKVSMGKASFDPGSLPASFEYNPSIKYSLEIAGEKINVFLVSIGNPHCIVQVKNICEEEVKRIGPLIENHRLFPNRTNVQLVNVINRENISIGIWERGAGYTIASGTSSCAAACVMRRLGNVEKNVNVHMKGGHLKIFITDDYNVSMYGPVQKIMDFYISPEWFL